MQQLCKPVQKKMLFQILQCFVSLIPKKSDDAAISCLACAIVFPILVLKWLEMVMTLENIEIIEMLHLHCRNNTIL